MQELVRKRLIRALDKSPRRKPRFDSEELLAEFSAYSRQPYVEILAEMVQCIPTPDALQDFADAHPDRWANAVSTMGRLAGYHEKLEVYGNVNVDIRVMGDAQLMAKIKEVDQKLVDLSIEDVDVEEDYIGQEKVEQVDGKDVDVEQGDVEQEQGNS